MKDHEIAQLVNELESVCNMFYGTQQLREHIARVVKRAVLQGSNTNSDLIHAWTEEVRTVANRMDKLNVYINEIMQRVFQIEERLKQNAEVHNKTVCNLLERIEKLENSNAAT